MDITTDGHLERTGKSLEDTFDLVVFVITFGLDVKVDAGGIGKRLEEVEEHLGWHVAYFLAMEFGIPYEPSATAEIEGYLAEAVIHWEAETIAADASLVAEGLRNTFAQGNASIFDGVVLIDVEIAFDLYGKIHT